MGNTKKYLLRVQYAAIIFSVALFLKNESFQCRYKNLCA